MKKLLSITLIFTMFAMLATYANAMIVIDNEEELFEMRKMAEASDEEIREYLFRSGHLWGGMTNRRSIISFLDFIDSLPLLYIEGTRFSGIIHYFTSQSTYITFSTDIGETYSFSLTPNDENINRVTLFTLDVNGGRNINVYSTPESAFNEHGAIFYLMEIDGFLVRAGYNRGKDNEHITTFNPQEAYKDMIITSFAEAPWSTINTVEDEPISFTTAEALTILRAVAGVAELTDAQIARFEISGAPATADAMRVLRIVAGLQ
jgi:hypothetical protein